MNNPLLQTYLKNMKFLKFYDIELFNRIETISDALRTGKLPQRYDLVYIENQKNYDIFDKLTNTYILNKTPQSWVDFLLERTQNNLEWTLSTINFNWFTKAKTDFDNLKNSENEKYSFDLLTDLRKYVDIYDDNLNNDNKKVHSFNKFIFFGTLNGIHINPILKSSKSKDFFICEENIEIFRLSLFLCDYTKFIENKRTVVFSIMDNDANFAQKFDIFWKNNLFENTLFKYSLTNHHTENYYNKIVSKIRQNDPFAFNYYRTLNNIIKSTTLNFNNYKTINFSKVKKNTFEIDNILLVGPGPSLSKNIQWIKENQNRFIIISLGAAIDELSLNGIVPDIVTSIDPHHELINKQFESLSDEKLKDIIKIISLNSHDNLFKLFDNNKGNLFTYETLATFQEGNIPIDGTTIGEATFKILLLLNIKNLYLLGIDLAIDSQTNLTHVKSHKHSTVIEDNFFYIDGNLQKKVKTIPKYHSLLFHYALAILKYKKKEQNIYNLSDGAYISNTIPAKINELKLKNINLNKTAVKRQIIENLNEISTENLPLNDLKRIKEELDFLDDILTTIDKLKKFKVKNYFQLKEKSETLIKKIFAGEYKYLKALIFKFYFSINRYMEFVFNDEELYKDKKLLNQFKDKWCENITNLLKQHGEYLRGLAKE